MVADSSDADNPDLYIVDAAWIRDGIPIEMPGVEGVYLPGSAITYIQLLPIEEPQEPPSQA